LEEWTNLKREEIIPDGIEGVPGHDLGFVFDTVHWYSDDLHLNVRTGCVVGADVLTRYYL
jgi:hypothetical protein